MDQAETDPAESFQTLSRAVMRDAKSDIVIAYGHQHGQKQRLGCGDDTARQPLQWQILELGQTIKIYEQKPATEFLRPLAELSVPNDGNATAYRLPLDGVTNKRTLTIRLQPSASGRNWQFAVQQTRGDKDLFSGFFR